MLFPIFTNDGNQFRESHLIDKLDICIANSWFLCDGALLSLKFTGGFNCMPFVYIYFLKRWQSNFGNPWTHKYMSD